MPELNKSLGGRITVGENGNILSISKFVKWIHLINDGGSVVYVVIEGTLSDLTANPVNNFELAVNSTLTINQSAKQIAFITGAGGGAQVRWIAR